MSAPADREERVTIPATKTARQNLLAELIREGRVSSQAALIELLAERGIVVTQATLSRDLYDLGAVKIRAAEGYIYELPSATGAGGDHVSADLPRVMAELLVSVSLAQNQVVLRTPAGAAQYVASAIDRSTLRLVVGTIAGDDTVLLIAPDSAGAAELRALFLGFAEQAHDIPRVGSRPARRG